MFPCSRSLPVVRASVLVFLSALSACGGGSPDTPEANAAAVSTVPEGARQSALAAPHPAVQASELLTSFEAEEYLQATLDGQSARLLGIDVAALHSAPEILPGVSEDPGALTVQFQGGDETQRQALITDDPVHPGNHVLGFKIFEPNVSMSDGSTRGRVQLNAYDSTSMHAQELRFSVRMYLPADVGLLRNMSRTMDWLTISEWWNDAAWVGSAFPFRVSVNLVKPIQRRGTPLYFQARAQTMDVASQNWSRTVWQVTNRSVPLPVGQWMTLEYSYLQGNAKSGRFYMAMTPDGGQRKVLFDVRSWTQHPNDPAPDGLTHVNPMKLYTSSDIVNYVRDAGGVLSVYWDDLSFRLCPERGPESTSPCAPASVSSGLVPAPRPRT